MIDNLHDFVFIKIELDKKLKNIILHKSNIILLFNLKITNIFIKLLLHDYIKF